MQDPKTYIEEQLSKLAPAADFASFKNREELEEYIARAALSKKFRKWAVDGDLPDHLHNAIRISFEKNEPIKFVMPFGGYKLWRLPEAPEADWAELFSLMFYAAWLKPIADAYVPGVRFDFSSDDVVVERLDRIAKADTEAYKTSFESTVTFLEDYIPQNLKFTFTPVGSRYTPEEFDAELNSLMAQYLAEHNGKLPEATEDEKKIMDLNAHKNEEDLADPDWYRKNKLMHDSYMTVSRRRPYTRNEEKILAFTKSLPKGIAVGTTKTSIAKFWAGVGALKHKEDSYIETVLSPEQIRTAEVEWNDITIAGLTGKNFSKIRIIK